MFPLYVKWVSNTSLVWDTIILKYSEKIVSTQRPVEHKFLLTSTPKQEIRSCFISPATNPQLGFLSFLDLQKTAPIIIK